MMKNGYSILVWVGKINIGKYIKATTKLKKKKRKNSGKIFDKKKIQIRRKEEKKNDIKYK